MLLLLLGVAARDTCPASAIHVQLHSDGRQRSVAASSFWRSISARIRSPSRPVSTQAASARSLASPVTKAPVVRCAYTATTPARLRARPANTRRADASISKLRTRWRAIYEGVSDEALRDQQRRRQQELTGDIQAIIERNKQEALKEAASTGQNAGEAVAERINKLMQMQVSVPGHTLGADLSTSLGSEDAAVVAALADPRASSSANLVQAAAAQLAADEQAGTTSAKKITATLRSFRELAEQDLRAQAFDPHTPVEQKLAIQRDGENGVTRLAQRYIDDYRAAYDRIAGGRGRSFDKIVASADDADEALIRNLSFGGGRTSNQGELDHAIKKRDVEAVLTILRRQPSVEQVRELEAAYNQLGTGRDLRETLFGSVMEGDGEYSSSVRPASIEEATAGDAVGGLVKGRDAAQVQQLGKPTQAQLAGPDNGAAAKAQWYAAGGRANRRRHLGQPRCHGPAAADRRRPGDPAAARAQPRRVGRAQGPVGQDTEAERARLLQQMRKLRATLSGDAAPRTSRTTNGFGARSNPRSASPCLSRWPSRSPAPARAWWPSCRPPHSTSPRPSPPTL